MSESCEAMNKFGKGIGNAARYRILQALFSGPKTVSEITKTVRLSQPAVSQHLKILKGYALVEDQKNGQTVHYSINTEHIFKILKTLADNFNKCR